MPAARRGGGDAAGDLPSRVSDATRAAILQAAEIEFAERGFGGARARAIAERAGVNNALPFYHFGSKRELYEAVLARMVGQLGDLVQHTIATSPRFDDRLEAFVHGLTLYLAENPNWLRIIVREFIDEGSNMVAIARRHLRPLVSTGAGQLSNYIKSGEIRDIDPLQVMISITAEVSFYFLAKPLLEALGMDKPLSPSMLAARERAVLAMLKRGLLRR